MIREYCLRWRDAWNSFWFVPRDAMMLGVLRILVGSMLVYTHAVWSLELETFFGNESVIPQTHREMIFGSGACWSHFDWLPSSSWLWPVHLAGLAVMLMFMLGCWTRVTGVLTWLLVISYANRATGAQFGLDQINGFMACYLAIGNAGAVLSIDAWRAGQGVAPSVADVRTNIATRLMQLHLVIVYLFAGLGKAQGDTWWNGEAIWGALASHEYQTIDLTWLADYMWLVNLITLVAFTWELAYAALIWPRLTRPIMLLLAILVHLGIGLAMGMLTFGLIMIYANLSFVDPVWLRQRLKVNSDP